jgi:hypothetical protein
MMAPQRHHTHTGPGPKGAVSGGASVAQCRLLKLKKPNLNREDAKNAKFKRSAVRPWRLRGEKNMLARFSNSLLEDE